MRSGLPITWRSNRPGRQQRGIEDVGAIGRGDDDDALVAFEAVHLDQQLIQRLLALFVALSELPPRLRPTASSSSMKIMQEP